MLTFSTDDLPANQRFDHWREARAKAMYGTTIEMGRERRASFHGRISARQLGLATIAEMQASAYHVSRTQADISRVAAESLCVYQQVHGLGWIDFKDSDEVLPVTHGTISTGYSDLPMRGTPTTTDDFHFRVLKIPLMQLAGPSSGLDGLRHQPLEVANALTHLVGISFEAMFDEEVQDRVGETFLRDLARLALLARGCVPGHTSESRAALRSGYFQAARRTIADNLHRPELSPEMIARTIGISARQLHVLFEPTGTSVSRTILARRLQKAHRLLTSMPVRPVTDVAFDCGFASLPTFYRAFRQRYGISPGDLRVSMN